MYYYIVNPAAGSGAINSIQDRLKTTLHSLNIDGEFAKTLGPGDAAKITAKALTKGVKTIVAVGGGETVNEVIAAVHDSHKPDVAIGIIPLGRQNLLAKHLGIDNWRQACDVLAGRRITEYSLMSVNDQVFIYALAIAAPNLGEQAASSDSWLKQLRTRRPPQIAINYKVTVDKTYKIRGQATALVVNNQRFLDTKLDNQLVLRIYEPPQPPRGLLGRAKAMLVAKTSDPSFSQLHASAIEVRTQKMAEANLDGKIVTGKHFEVALTNQQLRLISHFNRPQNMNSSPS
ncbi:hypothetical protein HY441_01860 [Candidatus Microgenomates bacterium]|nr:hypothetical protein [Candidatus Microgenomates bacterium]